MKNKTLKTYLIIQISLITLSGLSDPCPNKAGLSCAIGATGCTESGEKSSYYFAPAPLTEANCDIPMEGSQCELIEQTMDTILYTFVGPNCDRKLLIGSQKLEKYFKYKVPSVSSCNNTPDNPSD